MTKFFVDFAASGCHFWLPFMVAASGCRFVSQHYSWYPVVGFSEQ
jgi:hypothetical protein